MDVQTIHITMGQMWLVRTYFRVSFVNESIDLYECVVNMLARTSDKVFSISLGMTNVCDSQTTRLAVERRSLLTFNGPVSRGIIFSSAIIYMQCLLNLSYGRSHTNPNIICAAQLMTLLQ